MPESTLKGDLINVSVRAEAFAKFTNAARGTRNLVSCEFMAYKYTCCGFFCIIFSSFVSTMPTNFRSLKMRNSAACKCICILKIRKTCVHLSETAAAAAIVNLWRVWATSFLHARIPQIHMYLRLLQQQLLALFYSSFHFFFAF